MTRPIFFLIVALLAISACTSSPDRTVYIVRHAEKCTAPASDPALTPAGEARSRDLASLLSDAGVTAIYSTPFRRTEGTVAPLAETLGLEVTITPVEDGYLDRLAETLQAAPDRVALVSGHSNTVPPLVNRLAGTDYPDLDESIYDRLYVVTLHADGARTVDVRTFGGPSAGVAECR